MTDRIPAERLSYLSNPAGLAEAQDKYLDALEESEGRITDALEVSNVSWRQVKGWRSDENFADREKLVHVKRKDKTRKVVYGMIDAKNERVAIKAMDSLEEFRKETKHVHEGEVNINHHTDGMTATQRRELLEKGLEAAIELERIADGTYGGGDEASDSTRSVPRR